MNEKFFDIAESISAMENFVSNNTLKPSELYESICDATGTDDAFGVRVLGNTSAGLFLEFGHNITGFLEERNADIRRKHTFLQRCTIGSYINVTITKQNSDGSFSTSRKSIIYEANKHHRESIKQGDIVTGTVIEMNENFVLFDIGGGDCSGSLHASNIANKYVKTADNFFVGQENVKLQVLNYNEDYGCFELQFKNVRQSCQIKTNSVVLAKITGVLENERKKYRCIFPDYGNIEGIVYGVPKEYILRASAEIPVTVTDIKHGMPIAKF